MPGAFAKTLQDRKGRIAFCYMHEIDEPIAKILVLEEREKGLWVEAMISASEEDIQTKVAEKIIQEMSIGYSVVQYGPEKFMGDQTSYLQELKLYEISLVTIAMNEMAVIESMKSEERTNHVAESFERLLINERNDSKKYELMKLKNFVEALLNFEPVKPLEKPEPQITKSDILNILNS